MNNQSKTPFPRINPLMLDDNIDCVNYLNIGKAVAQANQPDHERHHCMTLCVLVLKNGFVVTGESSCVSLENYDEETGRDVAFENAREKLWPLMGYALRDHMHYQGSTAWAQPAKEQGQ